MDNLDNENYIWGKNAIFEILSENPGRVNKIFIQENIFLDKRLNKILELARANNVVVKKIHAQKLKSMSSDNTNFQKIAASISPVEYLELEDFLKIKKEGFRKIVILDSIQDPHNFGAIIRTAASAGYDAIIVPSHRSAPVTSVVERASSGAINHIPIIKTSSLSGSIDILKKHDFWVIATRADAQENYFEIDYTDMHFALVMGSEGSGISKTILNKADFTVKIPCAFESLNVSAAAAVIIYESVRQNYLKNLKRS